jgi:hypothetical protein
LFTDSLPYESWKYMSEQCTNYTKSLLLKEMQDLPYEDRQSLVDNNAHVMFVFKMAAHFGETDQGQ